MSARIVANQETATYGTPEPSIHVVLDPTGARGEWRQVQALLHRIAAALHERTDARDSWGVVVDGGATTAGRVYLELAKGTPEETARGMALVREVADLAKGSTL